MNVNARVADRLLFTDLPMPRVLAIAGAYAVGFFVLLPGLLWTLGARWDAALRLPSLPAFCVPLGALAVAAGLWGMQSSMWKLWTAGRGLPMSHLPPRDLVTSGLYGRFRHPIYVSYTLALAGAGFLAASPGRALLAPAVLTIGWVIYALGFEEPRLVARHGPACREHLDATPLFMVSGRSFYPALRTFWRVVRPPLQWLADHPVLFHVGPTVWVTFGALAAASAAITLTMIAGLLAELGLTPPQLDAYTLGLVLSILAGARAVWLLYQVRGLRAAPLTTLRTPGFVSWGGYIGLVAFSSGFAWFHSMPVLEILDRAFLPAIGCCGISRLACISYGCCYGTPAAWGIRWRRPESKAVRERGLAGAEPRVPTPAIVGVMALLVFAILVACTRRHPPAGFTTGLGLFLYALGRFAIDTSRDEARFTSIGLTAGQIGSASAGALGLLLMLVQGPPAWPHPAGLAAFRPVLSAACLLSLTAVSFVAYGFHWRRVGRW